ncbi:MAG: 4Fe-4S binding protein [Acholeplasmatales bacterium]|jgi:iron only hydrogenase large subunit-like protein|nr:4Fe-4S binding protein [Acholeplasmatales bacterium]
MIIENALLNFKYSKCKDCYKCLRECPVKAIKVKDSQAKIIAERCILCGKCTTVCPQNAKQVHSEVPKVLKLLREYDNVIAIIDSSYISSFNLSNFAIMEDVLSKLGFKQSYDCSEGSAIYSQKLNEIIQSGTYKNIITSTCPSINKTIELYYHDAFKYLVPLASPMVIQAKLLKEKDENAKIVYIGPCISKKLEAVESKVISAVITFEQLLLLMVEKDVDFNHKIKDDTVYHSNIIKAKLFPIARGIMKSVDVLNPKYEYMVIDGLKKSIEVLENIESCENIYLEMTACEFSCINGPCSLIGNLEAISANARLRKYVKSLKSTNTNLLLPEVDYTVKRTIKNLNEKMPSEEEIEEILKRVGKHKFSDELNCGACGYNTCRDKAFAVFNGYASSDMCVPYMKEKAESMSFEIIQKSPNGILLLDSDFKIIECNQKFIEFFSLQDSFLKGENANNFLDVSKYKEVLSANESFKIYRDFIPNTNKHLEITICTMPKEKMVFGLYNDITSSVLAENELNSLRLKTINTTDEVIKKQMFVAQEIASLLGETTAQSKIALIKLKRALLENDYKEE